MQQNTMVVRTQAARPMELLLVGLAGCTGMDVLSMVRKKRQQVITYEVLVTGVHAQDHPMVFVQIAVTESETSGDRQKRNEESCQNVLQRLRKKSTPASAFARVPSGS